MFSWKLTNDDASTVRTLMAMNSRQAFSTVGVGILISSVIWGQVSAIDTSLSRLD